MVKWKKGKRLPPETFDIPVKKIKSGWYSDKYFVRTREILKEDKKHSYVLMQVFTRKSGIVCGLDEAIAILKLCADRPDELKIKALHDGDKIKPMETVMIIEGDYSTFAHLETVYLGVIARPTAVATAVDRVVKAARGRQVLFFPARFDHYRVQTTDGYAAFISGALGVSTDAQGLWWGEKGLGTVPHGLIAAYNRDTLRASIAFDEYMPEDIQRIVLVDFENDCVEASLKVARVMGRRLWGVRLDTAENLRDKSVKGKNSYGVCPELVFKTRKALDREGFNYVNIIVSSGFDEEKIKHFIKLKVPFDAVGVGESLFKEKINFTADIVMVDGRPCAKVGRKYNPNPRLKLVR
ncbi:MAG: quinolinate phosphoribosyl transferase [Elusimicrobia bacterium CG1_02_37_114]|nr:MAG: quinolinate phosphoribosyl transferase [Elusimicrobia bacterium CG1_02_37_114]PIV53982.1 MAG: quinolinate phosphoribosyl transferase [Elusimicrobia bacterium CG02_land_8_20_14_3_00_37_13]